MTDRQLANIDNEEERDQAQQALEAIIADRAITTNGSIQQVRLARLKDAIMYSEVIKMTASKAQLWALWEIYRDGLWAIDPEAPGMESFREWVDQVVAPKADSSLLWDMVRVIERQFMYVHVNPVFLPDGGQITPESLLHKPGLAKKLKSTSALIEDPMKQDPKKDELIIDTMRMPFSAIREKYIAPRQDRVTLYYRVEVNNDGTLTVIFRNADQGMSTEQYEVLMALLGETAKPLAS